jgi:hypothetical protein
LFRCNVERLFVTGSKANQRRLKPGKQLPIAKHKFSRPLAGGIDNITFL